MTINELMEALEELRLEHGGHNSITLLTENNGSGTIQGVIDTPDGFAITNFIPHYH